jgi:tRNA A37 threonylcarbamoyladenosine modification protein TsaB
MAKIYAFANGAKLVPINTLDVISLNACDAIFREKHDVRRIGVILDAKRGQFFAACYNRDIAGNITRIKDSTDRLITASEFVAEYADRSNPIWLLGEGLAYYSKDFQNEGVNFVGSEYWPAKASNLLKLGWEKAIRGEFADPYKLTPHYLRGPDAIPKKSAATAIV